MNDSDCPKCGHGLGIIAVEKSPVGALLKHECRSCNCDVVLIVVSATGPCMTVRIATQEEAPRPVKAGIGVRNGS